MSSSASRAMSLSLTSPSSLASQGSSALYRRRNCRRRRGCRRVRGPGRRSRRRGRACMGEVIWTSLPSIRICPSSGSWTPLRHLIRVDFPAPLSPRSASTSLRFNVRLTLFQGQGCSEALGKVPISRTGPPFSSLSLLCLLGLHVSCLPGLECTEALLEPAPGARRARPLLQRSHPSPRAGSRR